MFWGVLSLALAAVWVVVWPADKAEGVTGLHFVALRWSHAAVWVLLAAAAFSAATARGARAAQVFGVLALACYGAFLISLIAGG